MEINTIQMAKWRLLKDTDIQLIDVTFKSAKSKYKKLFAPPSFKMIMEFKQGKVSEREYTNAYLDHLNHSSKVFKKDWIEFLSQDKVALACYCRYGKFCHRHILAQYLIQFSKENNIEVTFNQEIQEVKNA